MRVSGHRSAATSVAMTTASSRDSALMIVDNLSQIVTSQRCIVLKAYHDAHIDRKGLIWLHLTLG